MVSEPRSCFCLLPRRCLVFLPQPETLAWYHHLLQTLAPTETLAYRRSCPKTPEPCPQPAETRVPSLP